MKIQEVKFKNISVQYSDQGEGDGVVLLHGYIESLDIWKEYATNLAKLFRVISIDLPGHGASGQIGEVHSMELMADAVEAVVVHSGMKDVVMVGHSMGGYVAMAYMEVFFHRLSGLILLHSSPFADDDVKKENRDRAIDLIRKGKKQQLVMGHAPSTFAGDNVHKFTGELEKIKKIGMQTPDSGIISALRGMKKRPNRSHLLKNAELPVQIIYGMKDNFIPEEVSLRMIRMTKNPAVIKLWKSGHMGFIEEPEKVLDGSIKFIKQCYQSKDS